MKNLLLILVMFISSITFAQNCGPATDTPCPPDPVVFDFACDFDPTNLTDKEIEAFADRDALLQALVGLTTFNGNTVTAVNYESTTAFIVEVEDSALGSFTANSSGHGGEPILDDMHPQHFRTLYQHILDYILTKF